MNRKKIVKLKKINIKRYFSLFISLMLILNSVNHQFIDNKVFAGKEGLSGTDENLSEVQKVQEVENEIVDNFE
ncbi:MAG: hypothetical protein LBT82_02025, partial [Oscillospiraceae bacterium]|nr:hypothetical protein [Oscillospiraceae bacterium]